MFVAYTLDTDRIMIHNITIGGINSQHTGFRGLAESFKGMTRIDPIGIIEQTVMVASESNIAEEGKTPWNMI